MTKWHESDNPDRVGWSLFLRGVVVVVLITVVGGLIAGAVWFVKVQTSGVKGAGDVQRTNNSAPNRIAAQKEFEQLYAGILAADKRIDIAAAALKRSPADYTVQTRYEGSMSFCTQLVADYNAKARQITSADWRSPDLPQQIDDSSSITDCKETAK